MTYSVSIPQLPALQKAFAQAPQLVAKEVTNAGNRALVRYQATAKQKSPVAKGTLRGSIQIQPMTRRGNTIEGSVGTSLGYAIWQEQGTGIYGPANRPIRPRNGKMMVFTVGGKKVFARSVKGTKPKWYMRGSLEQNAGATAKDFDQALSTVANSLGGRS